MDELIFKLADEELEHVAEDPKYYITDKDLKRITDIIESYDFQNLLNRNCPVRKCFKRIFDENKNTKKIKELAHMTGSNFFEQELNSIKPQVDKCKPKPKKPRPKSKAMSRTSIQVNLFTKVSPHATSRNPNNAHLSLNKLSVADRRKALDIMEQIDAENADNRLRRRMERSEHHIELAALEKIKSIEKRKSMSKFACLVYSETAHDG